MTALIGNPLLLTSAPAADDGYQIEKSLRFNRDDESYLRRIPSSSGNRKTWTWAGWVKRTSATNDYIWCIDDTYSVGAHLMTTGDSLQYFQYESGSYVTRLQTSKVFRDFSAWYHIVFVYDSTNAIESERMRLYVNGNQITSFSQATWPSQNHEGKVNTAALEHELGRDASWNATEQHLDGYLADVHFIDGQALNPAAFGTFDSAGNWNAKAFSLPAPNDGTADWVGSSSGTFSTATSLAFNGIATTDSATNATFCNAGNNGTITLPGDGVKVNATLRLNMYASVGSFTQYTKIWVNGIEYTNLQQQIAGSGNSGYWYIPNFGGKTLTSVKWEALTGANVGLGGIEVDGLLLTNGQTNQTEFKNPHGAANGDFEAILTSDASGGTEGFYGNGPGHGHWKEYGFDGDLTTETAAADGDKTLTLTFNPALPWSRIIEFHNSDQSQVVGINGTTVLDGSGTHGWQTISRTGGELSTLTFTSKNTGIDNTGRFEAIRIDGQILLQDQVDNSFHLKFNDTSSNARLGRDFLNNKGIEDSSVNGALPIYNTTADSDGYDPGETKGSGYRTDSSAGTTDGTGLLLALPGDVLTDEHDEINTGSSAISLTNETVSVSTDQSRFYGSSLYFNGSSRLYTNSPPDDLKQIGSNSFTYEAWVYPTAVSSERAIAGIWESTGNHRSHLFGINAGQIWLLSSDNGTNTKSTKKGSVTANQWQHIAVTKSGQTAKFYVNGIFSGEITDDYATYNTSSTAPFEIGATDTDGVHYSGYINDLRFYRGVVKYTSNFTPPTRNDFTVNNLLHASRGLNVRYYHDDSNTSFDGNSPSGDLSAVASRWIGNPAKHTNNTGYGTNQNGVTAVFAPGGQGGSGTATFTFTGNNQVWLASSTDGGASWSGTGEKRQIYSGGDDYEYQLTGKNAVAWGGGSSDNWTQVVLSSMTSSEQEPTRDVDSSVDSPTNYGTDEQNGGEVRGNYATLNPLDAGSYVTLTQGNLYATQSAQRNDIVKSTIGMSSGKWYAEFTCNGENSSLTVPRVGLSAQSDAVQDNDFGNTTTEYAFSIGTASSGKVRNNSSWDGSGTTFAVGDTGCVAFDADTGKMWFGKNGTWLESGNPATAANPWFTATMTGNTYFWTVMTGDDNGKVTVNFGQRAWKYTCPSGFKALCTQNLDNTFDSETSENNPSKYFDVLIYEGDSVDGRVLKGLNFKPDMSWFKNRSSSTWHLLYDAIRGTGSHLFTNEDDAPGSDAHITAFNDDGVTMQHVDSGTINADGSNYVGWFWDAGTAASGANNDGSINISSGNQWVNATAGFSITKYTGTGSAATIGHGLGAKPEVIIIKRTDSADHWLVYHKIITAEKYLYLNSDGAPGDDTSKFNDTEPTNTVFSIGTDGVCNGSGGTYMAYAWTSIPGYSKFGKYTGNGSTDGAFIYLGFRPRYFMTKRTDSTGLWCIYDSRRSKGFNQNEVLLRAHLDGAELTLSGDPNIKHDMLSNGFKYRNGSSSQNGSGNSYAYLAFAEHPFKIARAV